VVYHEKQTSLTFREENVTHHQLIVHYKTPTKQMSAGTVHMRHQNITS